MSLLSPFENSKPLHLNILEPPSPEDALFEASAQLAMWLRRRGFLYKSCMNFHYVSIFSPLNRKEVAKIENLSPLEKVWLFIFMKIIYK